jgi:uroporphyrinogen-III synthase
VAQGAHVPALVVSRIDNPKPNGVFDTVLITSRHAVCDDLPDLPIIAVGAETAKHIDGDIVQIGDGGVRDLNLDGYQNILYPCAVDPSYTPPNTTPWHVYETRPNPDFKIDEDITHIAVFSIKGADVVMAHANANHHFLCLSQNIADHIQQAGFENLAVCTHPTYNAMKLLMTEQ